MLAIDSDVFIINERYLRDSKFVVNRAFLEFVEEHHIKRGTTVFNVYEVCGVLSFNFNQAQLIEFHANFGAGYGVVILYPKVGRHMGVGAIRQMLKGAWLFITRKMSFQDALVISTLEAHSDVDTFITWNARHFAGKTRLQVMTPEECLAVLRSTA